MNHPFTLRPEHVGAIDAAYRADFRDRLAIFLRGRHPPLTDFPDYLRFLDSVIVLADRVAVREEEGVAWLAAILLAGRAAGSQDWSGPEQLLRQPGPEEERVESVHRWAEQRGWIRRGAAG